MKKYAVAAGLFGAALCLIGPSPASANIAGSTRAAMDRHDSSIVDLVRRGGGARQAHAGMSRAHGTSGGMRRSAAQGSNRASPTRNANRTANRSASRDANRSANRDVNRNANRNVNRNINRSTVGAAGGWARPSGYWWRPGGAIAAGAAVGFVSAATAAAWAGSPPDSGACWYYTDESKRQGFWDTCPQ
jgi:hypothetical protein